MSDTDLKVNFNAALFQVTLTITPDHIAKLTALPKDLFGNAKKIMNGEFKEGRIEGFQIYESRLSSVFERLKRSKKNVPITVILAAGYPKLEGLRINACEDDDRIAGLLSIKSSPETIKSWQPRWIELAINMALFGTNQRKSVSYAQVQAAWYRGVFGTIIQNTALGAAPTNPRWKEKPILLKTDAVRQQIDLLVGDLSSFDVTTNFNDLECEINKYLPQLFVSDESFVFYKVFRSTIRKAITKAFNSPCLLKIELPFIILGAVGFNPNYQGEGETKFSINSFDYCGLILWKLVGLEGFESNLSWIKKRLCWSVSDHMIKTCLKTFSNSSMIKRDQETKKLEYSDEIVENPHIVCGTGIGPFHSNVLTLANESIRGISKTRRFLQALTFTIADAKVPEIRSRLHQFNEKILSLTENSAKEHLYQLSVQFFPMTRTSKKGPVRKEDKQLRHQDLAMECCKLVIREMIGVPNFSFDAEWIASRIYLTLSVQQIQHVLDQLKKSNFVRFDPKRARYVLVQKNVKTEKETKGESIIRFHENLVSISQGIIALVPVERRFVCSTFLYIPDSESNDVTNEIHKLLLGIMNLEDKNCIADQVFQLNMQLFPLTH